MSFNNNVPNFVPLVPATPFSSSGDPTRGGVAAAAAGNNNNLPPPIYPASSGGRSGGFNAGATPIIPLNPNASLSINNGVKHQHAASLSSSVLGGASTSTGGDPAVDSLISQVGEIEKHRRRIMMEVQETNNSIKLREEQINLKNAKTAGTNSAILEIQREELQLGSDSTSTASRVNEVQSQIDRSYQEEPILLEQVKKDEALKTGILRHWEQEKSSLKDLEAMWKANDPQALALKEAITQLEAQEEEDAKLEAQLDLEHRQLVEQERLRLLEAAMLPAPSQLVSASTQHTNSGSGASIATKGSLSSSIFNSSSVQQQDETAKLAQLEMEYQRVAASVEDAERTMEDLELKLNRRISSLEKKESQQKATREELLIHIHEVEGKINTVVPINNLFQQLDENNLCMACNDAMLLAAQQQPQQQQHFHQQENQQYAPRPN